ncbi:MAG: cytochrome c [Rhodobacterales bacterium]|nr:cytochrome c [Rhodobacterales bacterium]
MKTRSWIVLLLALTVVLIAAGVALVRRPEIDAVDQKPSDDRALVQAGWELTQLGNCANCHTAAGGQPFAGDYPLETPFGTIRSSNITPDRETGIGTWSEAAFRRAMREGVDREGAHLYPAFPYTHFTRASDEDIAALYAYFTTLAPVSHEVAGNGLPFPFNIRALMAGWNLLFLDKGPAPEPTSDPLDRGRYLVASVAHCGACHTPRNVLGAEKSGEELTGAEIDGWHAPALTGPQARGWSVEEMTRYLTQGFSTQHGAAAGPMAESVINIRRASPEDVKAMATYIASLTPDEQKPLDPIDNGRGEDSAAAQLYEAACAKCHESGRNPGPSNALSLSISPALRDDSPTNAVRTIIGGITDYRDDGGPYMPAFEDMLDDAQIAQVTRYLRQRYGDGPEWQDLDSTIAKARSAGKEQDDNQD